MPRLRTIGHTRATPLVAFIRLELLTGWRGWRLRLAHGNGRWAAFLAPLLALSLAPVLGLFIAATAGFYEASAAAGQGETVLLFAFAAGQVAALSFGVISLLSALFYANDLRLLLPLPFRPGEIALAKFMGVWANNLVTMSPLVLPALVIYGLRAGVGPVYWPAAALVYLALPLPALVLAAAFSFLLMRLTRGRDNRDIIRVLVGLFAVVAALGLQYLIRLTVPVESQGGGGAAAREATAALLASHPVLAPGLGRLAPTALWAVSVLRPDVSPLGRAFSLVLLLGTSVAALWVFLRLAERYFFDGLVGIDEERGRSRPLTRQELARATARCRPPLLALLQREVRLLNRNPAFLVSALLPPVVFPLFIGPPLFQSPGVRLALTAAAARPGAPVIPLLAVAAVLLSASLGNLAASAVSREGRHLWISRVIPVSPQVQVLAKLLHHLLFLAPNLLAALWGMAYLHLLTPLTLLYTVLGSAGGGMAAGGLALSLDLLFPHLRWSDPRQAMKANINIMGGMLLTGIVLAVGGLAAGVAWTVAPPTAAPVAVSALVLLAMGLAWGAGRLANRRYGEIEG